MAVEHISINLADLASILLDLKDEDRQVDSIIYLMLGDDHKQSLTLEELRMNAWLEQHVPNYTSDMGAVNLLAYQNGLVVTVDCADDCYFGYADRSGQQSPKVTARMPTTAALCSIITLLLAT